MGQRVNTICASVGNNRRQVGDGCVLVTVDHCGKTSRPGQLLEESI